MKHPKFLYIGALLLVVVCLIPLAASAAMQTYPTHWRAIGVSATFFGMIFAAGGIASVANSFGGFE